MSAAASLADVTATTLELLKWTNDVEPHANRALADYLASFGGIEAAVLLLADHGGRPGLVGPREVAAGRQLLGLRNRIACDTVYVFLPTASEASRMVTGLHDLFYRNGIHAYLGQALRFSEVADMTAAAWGMRPASGEAVFARWGYRTACKAEDFSE